MKHCNKCNKTKPITEFHNCASKKSGKMSHCKKCRNSYNRKKSLEIGHDVLYRRYRDLDPERHKEKSREYYKKNNEKIKANAKRHREMNPEKTKEKKKDEYLRNRKKYISRAKSWSEKNKERRKEIAVSYARRFSSDPKNKPIIIARKMLSRVLNLTGKTKRTKTELELGYTKEELRRHIEKNFSDGMSWENHGSWHIDHIVPISEMVSLGVECPKKINALSNLIPVWAFDNLSKGNRFCLSQAPL